MHDVLGDRMKQLEHACAGPVFDPARPLYARIDGRGFSRLTKGLARPFDARMTRVMQLTARKLVENTGAKAAYTQSDEISLVWEFRNEASPRGEAFFAGKSQKLCSVLAGLATAAFTAAIHDPNYGLTQLAGKLAHFDARLVSFEDRATAAEMIAWRGQDARRNAASQITRAHFSHKEMQNKSQADMREMLAGIGISIEDYPSENRCGTLILQRTALLPLPRSTWKAIPQHARPASRIVERQVLSCYTAATPDRIENLAAVLFEGAEPVCRPRGQAPVEQPLHETVEPALTV